MSAAKPLLAITMGDPAGVGPEVIVRAWQSPMVHEQCRVVALGHPEVFRRAVRLVSAKSQVVEVDEASLGSDEDSEPKFVRYVPVGDDALLDVPDGVVDARSGEAAFQALSRAIDFTLANRFQGIVTAPLSKAALHAAGHGYPGHTELLAERCGVSDFAMMLYLPTAELPQSRAGLGVVHVTLHMALQDVFTHLTSAAVLEKCHLVNTVMHQGFGLERPRIGVCALNPHGGEAGLFGSEESEVIAPGVQAAQEAGLAIAGPFPADTLMVRARDGEFDAVVAMYHDQGHIALKLLGMHRAVNITLGLPIVRTSVAHGTAFDRAWQGDAEATGMVAAITTAAQLARNRRER